MNRLGAWVMGLTLLAGAGVWSVNRTESDWVNRRIDASAGLRLASAHPITVAVVDTGILPQAALDGRRQSGYDFAAGSALPPHLINPHGTAVAGMVHSVDPAARILDVRLSDTAGQTTLRKAVDALRWAAGLEVAGVPLNPFPARVINASFVLKTVPHDGCVPAMQRAVNEILAHGSVIVVAAGNTNAPAWRNTPAGCRGVITVAATDTQDRRAPYSDWGAAIALSAPGGTRAEGVDVWWGQHRSERRGSSYAAPLVAGAASLLLAQHPEFTPAEVKAILQRSARPFSRGGCDPQHRAGCGAGVLDVAGALRSAASPLALGSVH
ncbi:S8 family serine peptidase [Deinococcus marmoris]|uniref:Serine protease, subtilase family n=1 Tax=Deinococcus marmoris TaxID=249408 RepID=A0A1U7NTM8_9DEIO|nr:S8 family serine peptidase [Deinococcus marmoris]OLV16279.1 serine protease, subtilase family [Deinococcus marmoris]